MFWVISLKGVRKRWRLWIAGAILLAFGPMLYAPRTPAGAGAPLRTASVRTRAVALTFDDGPNPLTTLRILHILEGFHAHATFFVVGLNVRRNPELVRAAVRAGMEIGNHTEAHINLTSHGMAQDRRDVTMANRVIRQAGGVTPTLLRPPYGAYDRRVIALARSMGLTLVLWTPGEDARQILGVGGGSVGRTMVSEVRPGDILVFPDGLSSERVLSSLPVMMRALSAQGYRFVTVSALLKMQARER